MYHVDEKSWDKWNIINIITAEFKKSHSESLAQDCNISIANALTRRRYYSFAQSHRYVISYQITKEGYFGVD